MDAPTDGGAGNKSQPGPGPMGAAPGPWAELMVDGVAAHATAGYSVVTGCATWRFACTCMAIASGEIGALADRVPCAMARVPANPPSIRPPSIKVMRPAAWISPRCNISGSGLMHFEFLPTNDFISSLLLDELQEFTTYTSQSSIYSPKH